MAFAIIILLTKPFSIFISLCTFFIKAGFIVLQTWINLARATISFHVNLFSTTLLWMVSLISLPNRVFSSLQRETLLEQHLHKIQYEFEILLWDREQLEDYLRAANKECRIMESMLAEVEEENDRAIAKIELLESELRYLSDENLRLKEIQGKSLWSIKDANSGQNIDKPGITDDTGIQISKSDCSGNTDTLPDLRNRGSWNSKIKRTSETVTCVEAAPLASAALLPFTPGTVPKDLEIEMKQALREKKDIALSQSIFSAMLSLLVGTVIWGSEDSRHCMPLIIALFIVISISLKSVVQFFSTVKNKPASDAVALLSFNWFVLGTVTYPILPYVARMLGSRP